MCKKIYDYNRRIMKLVAENFCAQSSINYTQVAAETRTVRCLQPRAWLQRWNIIVMYEKFLSHNKGNNVPEITNLEGGISSLFKLG
jgi:hypothetical protein